MVELIRVTSRDFFRVCISRKNFLLVFAVIGLLSGCVAKVTIPVADQFRIVSDIQEENFDPDAHSEMLLERVYQLMKANEGIEIPICTASKDSRQCIEEGFSVFVFGGGIPGVGKRTVNTFSEIVRVENQLEFAKDNNSTTFIGTPMSTRGNKCTLQINDGGLQVQMTRYYANWAGVGNMVMAEGWAIDYADFNHGILGLQVELDIKGFLVMGGGSRYVLLKFPKKG